MERHAAQKGAETYTRMEARRRPPLWPQRRRAKGVVVRWHSECGGFRKHRVLSKVTVAVGLRCVLAKKIAFNSTSFLILLYSVW